MSLLSIICGFVSTTCSFLLLILTSFNTENLFFSKRNQFRAREPDSHLGLHAGLLLVQPGAFSLRLQSL